MLTGSTSNGARWLDVASLVAVIAGVEQANGVLWSHEDFA